MLPSVRPLMQRWSCGPVWEFADRNQIINACCRHDEYIWFFRPRLADCCAIPSFDHYTCDDLRSAGLTLWLRPELWTPPSSGAQHLHFGTSMPSGGVHPIIKLLGVQWSIG